MKRRFKIWEIIGILLTVILLLMVFYVYDSRQDRRSVSSEGTGTALSSSSEETDTALSSPVLSEADAQSTSETGNSASPDRAGLQMKSDGAGEAETESPGEQEVADFPGKQSAAANLSEEQGATADISAEQDTDTARIMDGFLAIYNADFRDQKKSYIQYYNAKGEPMIILFEDPSEVEYMLYDRESDNAKCGQYVLYRADKADDGSWSPEAASILDMYAYVYDTGKVIRSGRTAWSDPGTQEYIDATEN